MGDAETAPVKETDEDTVAARRHRGSPDVDATEQVTEQVDAPHLVVGGDGVGNLGGVRNVLVVREQSRLLVPRLAKRVRVRLLANGEPHSRFDDVVTGELLAVLGVPPLRLGVEELVAEVTDLKQVVVGGRRCHQHIVVGTQPRQRVEVGQGLSEVFQLLVRVTEAVDLCHVLWRQKVVTENEAAKVLALGQLRGHDRTIAVHFRASHLKIGDQIATLGDALHRSREVRSRFLHRAEELGCRIKGSGVKVCDVTHRMPPLG